MIEGIEHRVVWGDPSSLATGVKYDSREVEDGDLFVAIRGFVQDGHKYVPAAVVRGAAGVVVEDVLPRFEDLGVTVVQVPNTRQALAHLAARFYEHPSKQLRVVGVTGTNGKTTTTHLIRAILEANGFATGLIGTIHNIINGQSLPVSRTTPEAPDLMRLMRDEVQAGGRYMVMEASSHALALNRTDGCEFDVAVFTNLSQDHLGEVHADLEEYVQAKLKLFRTIGTAYDGFPKPGEKFAVANADDALARRFVEAASVPVITYGLTSPADLSARDVSVRADGVSFILEGDVGRVQANLSLTGRFNVYNALAALAVGLGEGIELDAAVAALETVSSVPGRFQLVEEGQPFAVVVDYAHTPDGLDNILRTARELTSGRVVVVFGAGGDRDRTKRPVMGEIAHRLADYCVVTSDNPRTEDPEAIIRDVVDGMQQGPRNYETLVDREAAIFRAIGLARTGDTVIIAGKGHETYQQFGDRTIEFDDRDVARRAILRQRGQWS